ncbi:MAG: saccharopine dehydrogenase family protein [Verrucomicrobiota bacterium]
MKSVLIIGAGSVGRVVAHKCAQMTKCFGEICLASRRLETCQRIAESLPRPIRVEQVDAGEAKEVAALIEMVRPDLLIHVALPYQDLAIMDACLEMGVSYVDTANYEPPDEAKMSYHWQWEYHDRFREAGLCALLGCGFDPGVTSIFVAHAWKHHFDEIHGIDIVDCNAGDHGLPFATNFNPEINIREITAPARHWEQGEWIESPALTTRVEFTYPGIGPRASYLMYHEELESLARHIPHVKRMRFWMTFGDDYLTHLRVLEGVGMTSISPVMHEGREVVPLQFLKSVLPSPSDLGQRTVGKTCIGCCIQGTKDGESKNYFIYNHCDHEASYAEVGSQAVAYTTGVPVSLGASLLLEGLWGKPGVYNVEQFDPDPFLSRLGAWGLPWVEEVGEGTFEERLAS